LDDLPAGGTGMLTDGGGHFNAGRLPLLD